MNGVSANAQVASTTASQRSAISPRLNLIFRMNGACDSGPYETTYTPCRCGKAEQPEWRRFACHWRWNGNSAKILAFQMRQAVFPMLRRPHRSDSMRSGVGNYLQFADRPLVFHSGRLPPLNWTSNRGCCSGCCSAKSRSRLRPGCSRPGDGVVSPIFAAQVMQQRFKLWANAVSWLVVFQADDGQAISDICRKSLPSFIKCCQRHARR